MLFMDYNKAIHILNLSHDFTFEELKKSFKKKSLETHPDRKNGSHDDFINVKHAYEFLKEPKNKQENIDNTSNIVYFILLFINFITNLSNYMNFNRIMLLKPCIQDVLNHNIYKLIINNNIYYIPLWIDNIIIPEESILIKIEIQDDNICSIKYDEIKINNNMFLKKNIEINLKHADNNFICFLQEKYKIDIKNTKTINYNLLNKGCCINKKIYNYDNDYNILYKPNKIKGDISFTLS
tara:strand:+ start:100 stop:813 length:714 start_codon:yes stop_codon:yes gene_type:complete